MLRVESLRVAFDGVQALDGIDLEVPEGERIAILGPSGSGKSTVLRTIAGVQRPDGGRVLLGGEDLAGVPSYRRGIGLMLQEGALFPHRDVAGNVEFGLRMAGMPKEERATRTREVLELVGLAGFEGRPIGTLSGGERQRVALARSLAPEPRVLLLDEPLGSLDGPLRERLGTELTELSDRLGLTVVHVTHDVGEAFTVGDRVAIVRAGRAVQVGSPEELWARPATEWVARFLGRENILKTEEGSVLVPAEAIRLRSGEAEGGAPGDGAPRDGTPRDRTSRDGTPRDRTSRDGTSRDRAVVVSTQRRGSIVRVLVRLENGEELTAVTTEVDHPRTGDRVQVEIDPAATVPLSRDPQN